MALGALDAMKELGKSPGKDAIILSIDGLKEAVQHVLDGSIAAIGYNDPKLASVVFDTMERYANGESIPAKVVVKGPVIDKTNASTMLSEAF
jgi:ribose transport system substrate-binding protein